MHDIRRLINEEFKSKGSQDAKSLAKEENVLDALIEVLDVDVRYKDKAICGKNRDCNNNVDDRIEAIKNIGSVRISAIRVWSNLPKYITNIRISD